MSIVVMNINKYSSMPQSEVYTQRRTICATPETFQIDSPFKNKHSLLKNNYKSYEM